MTVAAAAAARSRVADYLDLTKPRLSTLVLATTMVGLWVAPGPRAGWEHVLALFLGTGAVIGGANALNCYRERDTDALMLRTRGRPLPAGRLAPRRALGFGLVLSTVGLAVLVLGVNAVSAGLAAFALASYVLVYTPLKRRTSLSTVVGAVPGAIPPMIGWAASTGRLEAGAWVLFGCLFLWQPAHFLALAWLYREDYARAGMPMLAVQDPGGHAVARQMLAYFGALVPVSTLVAAVSRAGTLTAAVAPVLGLLLVAATLPGVLGRPSRPWARRCFLGSIVYLSLWLLVLVVDAAAPRGALPVLGEAPRFELVDANGAPRTSAELWDRVWVAGFLFTRCTGPCPRLARRMRHLQAVLPERLPVRLVSFSVDPEHDTPAVLAAYARALDADGRRWWFLTGPRDRIRRIAVEGFHLPVAEAASDAQRAAHGPILHSTRLVLVDRRGRVRGYYECEDDGAQAALLRDIRALEAAQP